MSLKERTINVDIMTKEYTKLKYKQGDSNQTLKFKFYKNGSELDLTGYVAGIFYEKPNNEVLEKTGNINGNIVTTTITSGILNTPGVVKTEIFLTKGDEVSISFTILIEVESSIDKTTAVQEKEEWDAIKDLLIAGNNISMIDDSLTATSKTWSSSKIYSQIKGIENQIDNISTTGGGLSYTAKKAILNLFSAVAYYNKDVTDIYQTLKDALLVAVDSVTLDKTELTFTSATSQTLVATKSPVESEGTLVWTSSNTSVATVDDNGVVTATGNGECTITVTCGSVYATCSVSVSGILATYSITNNLTNVTTSNNIDNIAEGTGYIATLTPDSNYIISSVTVTMGGDDITSTAYSNGSITISNVTGDIVITAIAIEDVGWISGTAYDITWTDGYKVDQSTGENTEDSSRSVSDFLPCLGVSGLIGSSGINGGYLYAYDSGYNYLGRIIFNSSYPCAVNRNVAYVKIHCITTDKEKVTLSPITYNELSENTTWNNGQLYTISYIEKTIIDGSTGISKTSSDWWASNYVYCYGATTLNMLNYIDSASWRKTVVFYDSNKDYISGTIGSDSPYTIPENAVYFRVSGFDGFEYTIQKSNKPIISLV